MSNTITASIIGAGFAGSVVAERLASAGQQVLVIDQRPHIGGNAYDEPDAHGVLVHRYGPHIFHTNAQRVVDYLSRFTDWLPYEHRVLARVDGQLLPIPINQDTINRLYGLHLDEAGVQAFLARVREPRDPIQTSEDVVLNTVGRDLYEKFFRGYTRKQWGLDPSQLSAAVTARIPVRANRDDRYQRSIPDHAPGRLHRAVPADARPSQHPPRTRRRLLRPPPPAQGQNPRLHRPHRRLFRLLSRPLALPLPALRTPAPARHPPTPAGRRGQLPQRPCLHPHHRIQAPHRPKPPRHLHRSEYPQAEGDPYYPVPRPENETLYQRYKALAARESNVFFVGRLAQYRYYNMDQVVAAALKTAERILGTA